MSRIKNIKDRMPMINDSTLDLFACVKLGVDRILVSLSTSKVKESKKKSKSAT